jgi:hypothetical protein
VHGRRFGRRACGFQCETVVYNSPEFGLRSSTATHHKEHVRAIESAKRPETREKRIAAMMGDTPQEAAHEVASTRTVRTMNSGGGDSGCLI